MSWDDIKSDSDMRIDVNELRDFSNSDVVEKAEVNGEVRFFFLRKLVCMAQTLIFLGRRRRTLHRSCSESRKWVRY